MNPAEPDPTPAPSPPQTALRVDVVIESALWRARDPALPDQLQTALQAAAAAEGQGGELALLLADDACLRALNNEWRGKDQPTNVLSFPAIPPLHPADARFLGDIALAGETIAAEASAQDKTFHAHAMHLVVHGFLHLLGYDHVSDLDAAAMEARERAILAALGLPDPYA